MAARLPTGFREAWLAATARIAAVFVPLVPALVGCGVVNVLAQLVAARAPHDGLTPALLAVGGGFLALMAVVVGMNAAAEFGGTAVLGGAVAAVVPFAGAAGAPEVHGVLGAVAPGQGGVLAALAAGVLAARVERWAQRWCPSLLAGLLVPTVTVLLAGLVTVLVVQGLAGVLARGLAVGVSALLGRGGALAGAVLGGLFLPVVLLGLHQVLVPVHVALVEQSGWSLLLPLLAVSGAGQVGAGLAVALRTRDTELRRRVRAALLPALLGIGEPLLYTVTLPLGRPFVTACVGGAAGGAVVGAFDQWGSGVGALAIGPSGWSLLPLLSGPGGVLRAMLGYAAGMLVAHLVGFVATWLLPGSAATMTPVTPAAPTPTTTPAP